MDYKRFDIEVDPLEQGFTAESYDLVVASYCIHATRSLQDTLTNIRKVLKPGGTLMLIEATTNPTDIQLIFGTLPGWWLGIEPERQDSPNVSVEVWDRMLKASGFTGIDLEIVDIPDEEFEFGRVMASRALTEVHGPFSIVLPMGQKASDGPVERRNWLSELAKCIGSLTGAIPEIVSIDNVQAWQDTICVFVAEMEQPLIDHLDADGFEKLRKFLLNNAGVLWLSCGGIKDATDPAFGAADGLIRTMRQEEFQKRWVRLDFGYGNPWATVNIDHSLHVIKQSFHTACTPSDIESEFAVSDSLMHVIRVFPDKVRDALARNLKVDPTPDSQPYHQDDRPLILEIPNSSSGTVGLEEPFFVDHEEVATTEVPSSYIEIEAKAFGLNFRDVLIQLKQLKAPKLAHECSGIVTALGPNTEQSGLKVGDRVCALLPGRIASRGRAWWPLVAKIPDSMSWEHGASIPIVYTTAYLTLKHIAKLQPGESVLVHTAAGGTGQAAIVVAQSLGAEVFATCSTKSKRQLLMDQYGIPEQHFFSSRDASFASALKRAKPNGIDVALNTLSGPLLKATWDCMAALGRFIDITALDMQANRYLETKPFTRGAMYVGFDLGNFLESHPMLFNEALVESISIIQKRGAPMHPVTRYSISEMIPAMRQMQGGQHVGKLVIVPRDGDEVKVSGPLNFYEM
jgi:NADPH:quinone reductase-like Zn-dependent oxidoreductase